MTKEVELLIKKSTLRDVEIRLLEKEVKGLLIPVSVYAALKELENSYEIK